MKLSRYLFSILLFIFLAEPIFYPLSSSAATYQALSKIKTAGIFNTIRASLRQQLTISFSDPETDVVKEGAIAITMNAVGQKIVQLYFQEIPAQISKRVLLETAKLGYRLLNTSGTAYTLLDTLEKVSVAEANQIALNWLTQNNIKASGGDINWPYTDYQGGKQNGHLQYIFLLHPQTGNQAKIIIAFYSPEALIPADSRGSSPWPYEAWRQQGNEQLAPFIVEMEGQIQMDSAVCNWINDPTLSVNFPESVPQFSFDQSPSAWLHPFSWLKEQWNNLLSPVPKPKEIVITPQDSSSPEIEDLKKTVQSLKEVVEQQSANNNVEKQTPDDNSFSALAEGLKDLATVLSQQDKNNAESLEQINQIAQSQAEIAKLQAQKANSPTASTEIKETEKSSAEIQLASGNQPLLCSTDNLPQPSWNQAIFNEIAWMGTQSSPNNEWLELKNISSQPVNLDGWQVFNKNQNLVIHFGPEDQIPAHYLFLLERTDDETLPYQKANKIYQGGIKNSGETLYLFDAHCRLQDLVEANPNWPGGSNDSRRTMERKTGLEWQTSSLIEGTPGKENSPGYNPPASSAISSSSSSPNSTSTSSQVSGPIDNYPPLAKAGPDQTLEFGQPIILDASQSGDNVGIVSYKWDTNDDGLWNITQTKPSLTLESGSLVPGEHLIVLQVADATGQIDEDQVMVTILEIPQIVISEVQTAGENSQDEFVELFNSNQREVNLSQWSLKKKTASGTEMNLVSPQNFEGIIPPQGYFLIVPTSSDDSHGYQGTVAPDLYYSSSSNSVADNNTVLLYNPLGQLADKVGFGQEISDFESHPYPENPKSGLSLGRKWDAENQAYPDTDNNQEDFELDQPTPKSQNQAYYSGPVLTGVNFSLADSQTGSLSVTIQPITQVVINGDQVAVAWLLSETQSEEPTIDDSRWLTEKPSLFTLSAGDGAKTVFLWLKDEKNSLSPQYSASITLDENPPPAILDIALYPTKNNGEIFLTWTAPGEPGSEPVSQYIIKYGSALITEDKWAEAELVSQGLSPQEPGKTESFVVAGLDSSQTYYLAIKSQDEWDVSSPISNSPSRQAIAASGTPADPYIIVSCQNLQDVNLHLNSFYQLAYSIDCSATIDWNDGLGFEPLGDGATAFTGSLDGQGYTIDNLHINRTTNGINGYYIGFIGQAKAGAQISHLGLRNADIRGYQYVGGLIGQTVGYTNDILPITVNDCYTTGYLASSRNDSQETFVGGLIGSAAKTQVAYSWSSMEINAPQANVVGGLIGGTNIQTNISHSYATGKVSGHQTVGGLVGWVRTGVSVEQCWSQGEVSGDIVGGLVGTNEGRLENSYSQTKVSVTGNSGGGFVASNDFYGSISNSYSTGYVSGVNNAGFIQNKYGTVQGCYWDMNSSGQASSGKATGLTTAQMKNLASFPGWDFSTIWKIEEGQYPSLRE